MRKTILFSCLLVIFLTNTLLTNENIAYGHGSQCQCQAREVRIEDEAFLKQTLQKNESNIIYGKLVSLLDVKQEFEVGILLYEDTFVQRVNYEFSKILKPGYPNGLSLSYNGNPEFYFDVRPSFTQPIILQPNETQDYEIEFTPLKSGIYHIHTALYKDGVYKAGPGQTITVEGDFNLSEQELFKFYIPFYASVMLVLLGGTFGIILLAKKLSKRDLIRNSKILSAVRKTRKNIRYSLNRNQRKFIKIGSIVLIIGIIIQVFSFEKALEYTTVMYPEFNGEKSWLVKFDSYHTQAIQVFISGISLVGIGLIVLILGVKRELILIKFLNLMEKSILKIKKRTALESGLLLIMIGIILVTSILSIDQRCEDIPRLGHNSCGENTLNYDISKMMFWNIGIPLISSGSLLFIFGLKKKNTNKLIRSFSSFPKNNLKSYYRLRKIVPNLEKTPTV